MTRTLKAAAVAAVLLQCALALPARAQSDPSAAGQWSGPVSLPVVAIHMQLLPDGKVLAWGKPETPPIDGRAPVRLFDPSAGQLAFQEVANPFVDVYCSGHAYLADGRVLAVGGHIRDFVGSDATTMFDHRSASWVNGPRMSAGRWYPTVTTLANGDVLAVSGDVDTTVGVNRLPQVFEAATGRWRDLSNAQLAMPLYPWMHLAPNGKVFNSGPGQATRYLEASGSGAWTAVASTNFGDRRQYEGASVMYEPGKVLIVGGGNPATNTAEVIDLNEPAPAWRYTGEMAFARRFLNATILPDGKVLATGGSSSALFSDPAGAVYNAELWDPATGQWSTLAAMSTSRLYHSTAVLLPDGRVFVAGGGGDGSKGDIDHYDGEYFSPPYLFKGSRPAIHSAPGGAAYGETFALDASAGLAGITLVALSATTHEFNMSQRFVRLAFTPAAEAGRYGVATPADPNVAPPGYYMLFALDAQGVPSVARMLRLGAAAGSNSAPLVSAGADQSITLPAAAQLAGSASDDGAPGPLTIAWSKLSGPGTVSFANPAAASTTASFSTAGTYVLRLSASDGVLASSDDVSIVVNPAGSGGLSGSYYNGKAFETLVTTRLDPKVDFIWGYDPPAAGVAVDGFSVRWSGYVQAPVSGTYRFYTVSNDGVRLSLNGVRIVDNWTIHGTTTNTSAAISLTAGVKYPIQMEFFENGGWGQAQLMWSYPGQSQTVIPQTALLPAAAPSNSAPVANAGSDQTITLPASANLAGTATDDGQPGPLTTTWSKVSGPGTVTFGNANALATTAAFSAAGTYALRLTASDGAAASTDELTVTVNAAPSGSGGLGGSYYNGKAFESLVFTRVDPTVDFIWGFESPGTGVAADGFSVRWTGYVQAPVSGTYRFYTVSNDGVRLWVNGKRLINNWTVHGTTTNTSTGISLRAGVKYPVRMDFFENTGWGQAQLLWSYSGQSKTVIPQSQLSR